MGSNDFANTELALQLALNPPPSMLETTMKPPLSSDHRFEPSLTLALSGDSCGGSCGGSSFEESERVVNTSGEDGDDGEDGGVNGRKKLRLTKPQSGLLEQAFKLHASLNPKQKQELAKELKLRPRQVEVWFQNRRARTKLKQTEVDYEYLKKYCEMLMRENQRLVQEVQELKAQQMSQPIYMQLPATTLIMCPSCQQIRDTNSATKTPFTMAPKPPFFNPFTAPSAAC